MTAGGEGARVRLVESVWMGISNGTERADIEGGPCFRGGVSIIPEGWVF